MVLVNIYNNGLIPWINVMGPKYGLELSDGAYNLLAADPRVIMEKTTRSEVAEKLRKLKAEEEAKNKPEDKINVHDEVKIEVVSVPETKVEEPVIETEETPEEYTNENDDELDILIDSIAATPAETSVFEKAVNKKIEEITSHKSAEERIDIKKYTEAELSEMTKSKMKAILQARGYIEGPYAPKYHDTLADLSRKILKTQ